MTLALAAYVRPGRGIWLPLAIAALVVAVQALWLLPLLDKRIEARFTRYLSVIDLHPGRQTGA